LEKRKAFKDVVKKAKEGGTFDSEAVAATNLLKDN